MATGAVLLGVRFTDDAWRNFQEACLLHGLTMRSALEAAVELVFLFTASREHRLATVPQLAGPVLEEVVSAAWRAAAHIDARHRSPKEPRHKVTVRTESHSAARLREALRARGFTMNTCLVSVFTPWGSGWGDTSAYQVRHELWEWAAERARRRDHFRRRGLPDADPPASGPPPFAPFS